ncbi:MAG: sigma-70 family RNA polymerase sigma factor [Acidobacteria bacterium]|nr:sigma-70 family RNA polymerase sigma factor [Acidobacteriota bacterium]
MPAPDSEEAAASAGAASFATTHWSVVLQAGERDSPQSAEALEQLCRIYWYPLYAYVRRRGSKPEDAEDLIQGFFARVLEHRYFALADPDRGRFRTFLLCSLKNFLANEHERAASLKRGGGVLPLSLSGLDLEGRYVVEPRDPETPESLFERRWALTVVEQALARLRQEYAGSGRADLYDRLKPYVWGEKNAASYAEIGSAVGLSEEAVKKAVQRLRRRFAEALRLEITQTVSTPAELEEELRHLLHLLRG